MHDLRAYWWECSEVGSALAQSSSFAFRFQQCQDVAFTNWAFHISDDSASWVVEELHLHLCALSLGSGAAQDLDNASQNDWFIHFFDLISENRCWLSDNWREKKERARRAMSRGTNPTKEREMEAEKILNSFPSKASAQLVGLLHSYTVAVVVFSYSIPPSVIQRWTTPYLGFASRSEQFVLIVYPGILSFSQFRARWVRNCKNKFASVGPETRPERWIKGFSNKANVACDFILIRLRQRSRLQRVFQCRLTFFAH